MKKAIMIVVLGVGFALAAVPGGGGAAQPSFRQNDESDEVYVLYMTDEFDMGLLEDGIPTDPYYGWVSVDDFVLGDYYYFCITKITYWVISYGNPTGFYMRFWEDTGGSGPGDELESVDATYTLTSTGEYLWGRPIYEMEVELNHVMVCGHYWGAPYFSSGYLYMLCRTNAYDDQCYFDDGHGGSGPWYTSEEIWGTAYDFFQVIEGYDTFWDVFAYAVDPEAGDSGVPVDTDIVFGCCNPVGDGFGRIDTDTIVFTAEDQSRRSGDKALCAGSPSLSAGGNPRPAGEISGTLYIDDDDPGDVICTFTPDEDLPVDLITCTVDGCLADKWGHEMGEDFVWTFDTECAIEETTWGAIKAAH
jgi:hypothetical protein